MSRSSKRRDSEPGNRLLIPEAWLGGGDLYALGRHAVAAYLNASTDGVSYPMTATQVVNAFNDAFNCVTDIEDTKDIFEGFNEAGCPLD